MAVAFVYQPPARSALGGTRQVAIRLARHPSNREAAAIMGLAGYRSIERVRGGEALVRFERFGRDTEELRRRLARELRRVTTVHILDR